MKKIIASVLSIATLFSLPISIFAEDDIQSGPNTYFVSVKDGSDENDGSYNSPFKTFQKAQETLRGVIENEMLPKGGVTVYFREGNYEFPTAGIKMNESDSGTKNSPITYSAYNGEKVQFVGGIEVKQEDFRKTTDEKVLNRIYDENARPYIYECDLSYFPDNTLTHVKMAGVYGNPSNKVNFLIRDDKIETPACWPHEGEYFDYNFAKLEEVVRVDTAKNRTSLRLNDIYLDRINYWKKKDWTDMWIYNFFEADWRDGVIPVESIRNGVITVTTGVYQFGDGTKGRELIVYNLLPELDRPGEYYIDIDNKKLYYYPPLDTDKNTQFFITTLNDTFLEIKNAKNIMFKNILFNGCRKTGFSMTGKSENVVLDSCTMHNIGGGFGVIGDNRFEDTVKNCGIRNSTLKYGGGGVLIDAGDEKNLRRANCFVENCEFTKWDLWVKCYTTAIDIRGVGNKVSNNEMHNGAHMAASIGGKFNEFSYNNIYDVLKYTADSGAIYMGFKFTELGNVMKNNYIHDCSLSELRKNSAFGIRAFYYDDYTWGQNTFNNLVANFQGYGVVVNGGSWCETVNNVFYNLSSENVSVADGPRGADWTLTKDSTDHVTSSFRKQYDTYVSDVWFNYFPYMATVWGSNIGLMHGNVTKRNIAVDSKKGFILNRTGNKENHDAEDNIQMTADEIFVDAENGDFTIKPDSSVFTKVKGFEDIEFHKMGRYVGKAMKPVENSIVLAANKSGVMNKGKLSLIDEENPQVKTVLEDSRTFVPLRFIAEALGFTVSWDEATKTAALDGNGKSIKFTIGQDTYTVDGREVSLDAVPRILDGRTLIPLRACSEAVDKKVSWNNQGLIVIGDSENVFDDTHDSLEIEYLINKLDI